MNKNSKKAIIPHDHKIICLFPQGQSGSLSFTVTISKEAALLEKILKIYYYVQKMKKTEPSYIYHNVEEFNGILEEMNKLGIVNEPLFLGQLREEIAMFQMQNGKQKTLLK